MNSTVKKQQHEEFVSNLNGTTVLDNVLLITLPILLNACLSFWTINIYQLGYGDFKGKIWLNFVLVVVPYIFSITTCHKYLAEITISVAILMVMGGLNSLFLSKRSKYWPDVRVNVHSATETRKTSYLFISRMRGVILMNTAICILAVDMKIFPRKFAKTETYGLGPMDLGVGMFTLMMGLVDEGGAATRKKVRMVAVLLLLAVTRLVFVRMSNYQRHETEYGSHWNFFVTLAIVQALSVATGMWRRNAKLLLAMVAAVACLQYALLVRTQLEAVGTANVTREARDASIVTSNKEGLISQIGYILLWLVGCVLCHLARRCRPATLVTVLALLAMAGPVMVCQGPPSMTAAAVSRRVANLAYVSWTGSCMCLCLVLLVLADIAANLMEDRANYVTSTEYPDVYSVVNRHAMFHFLLANLLTGLVNVATDTLQFSCCTSSAVLITYSATTVLVVTSLDQLPSKHKRQ